MKLVKPWQMLNQQVKPLWWHEHIAIHNEDLLAEGGNADDIALLKVVDWGNL